MKLNHSQLPRKRVKARKVLENVRLVNKIYRQLRKASPRSSRQTTGDLAVDLGDLIFVGRKHQNDVKQLLKMTFPRDRTKFRKLLAQFEVNLLFENQWHLTDIKGLLPRLVRDAYRSSDGRLRKRNNPRRVVPKVAASTP